MFLHRHTLAAYGYYYPSIHFVLLKWKLSAVLQTRILAFEKMRNAFKHEFTQKFRLVLISCKIPEFYRKGNETLFLTFFYNFVYMMV